jgi:hypothetical protein
MTTFYLICAVTTGLPEPLLCKISTRPMIEAASPNSHNVVVQFKVGCSPMLQPCRIQ